MTREKIIREKAKALGFDAVGITAPDSIPMERIEDFRCFLNNAWYGDMRWLLDSADRRADPLQVWSEVKSVVMVGFNYAPRENPLAHLTQPTVGNLSVYARGQDYHDVLKARLKLLGQWMHSTYSCSVKVFADTAPIMEKPLAERAGLGWQGKHTNLVSQEFGSWLFLGTLFTTLSLSIDASHPHRCGTCRACLDVCPTRAFPKPYQLDARRCISYLTIEHKGPIPLEFRKAMGNRIYGCDDCLAVCPWNKFAQSAREISLFRREDLQSPSLAQLLTLDDAAFRRFFSKSPVKRTGRNRFVRNVLIAAGNSGDRSLLPAVERLLQDLSPLVRGAAAWAYRQLADESDIAAARAQGQRDGDASVRAEWTV